MLVAFTKSLEFTGLAQQLVLQGVPTTVPIPDIHAMNMELLSRAGIENPDRYFPGQQSLPPPMPAGSEMVGSPEGAMGAEAPIPPMAA